MRAAVNWWVSHGIRLHYVHVSWDMLEETIKSNCRNRVAHKCVINGSGNIWRKNRRLVLACLGSMSTINSKNNASLKMSDNFLEKTRDEVVSEGEAFR